MGTRGPVRVAQHARRNNDLIVVRIDLPVAASNCSAHGVVAPGFVHLVFAVEVQCVTLVLSGDGEQDVRDGSECRARADQQGDVDTPPAAARGLSRFVAGKRRCAAPQSCTCHWRGQIMKTATTPRSAAPAAPLSAGLSSMRQIGPKPDQRPHRAIPSEPA